jgi:hypothetical protein
MSWKEFTDCLISEAIAEDQRFVDNTNRNNKCISVKGIALELIKATKDYIMDPNDEIMNDMV